MILSILFGYGVAAALCFPILAAVFKDDIHDELQQARETGNRLREKQVILNVLIFLLLLAPLAMATLPVGLRERRLRRELVANLERRIALSEAS